jgi:UDP-N-acetylglucosamine--N-acetylmuramyl-(pentapeptide) pyrophosphoryl-undecaprenol N-acetylglucosamine transferase
MYLAHVNQKEHLVMKLAVSGGGTGGHVYPALTVIEALRKPKPRGAALPALDSADLLWIGSRGGMEEELVGRSGIEYVGLAAGGLRGMGPVVQLRNAAQIASSVGRARKILSHFKPNAILVTGGYVCVAVTLAGWTLHVPIMIYLPDVEPGKSVRFLSRFAAMIAVTSEESYHYFRRAKVTVTGYPVREAILSMDRESAQQALGLNPQQPTLLAFGGSRGAQSINRALVAGLRELLPACQVVHITGRLDADWVAGAAKSLPPELQARYHVCSYLHDMAPALVAADLAVARAGAATLGEFPAANLPAVLVPYPYAGQFQAANAKYMASNGAACVLADEELEQKLVPTVLSLLRDEHALAEMKESSRAMARRDAAETIAEKLWQLARGEASRATGGLA